MLWALVMAGGWGTRLWPLSGRRMPKPFLKLIPGQEALLRETIKRVQPIIPRHRIWIIGNEDHLQALRRHAPHIPPNQILGEPVSRNTAATVGLGASLILKRDPQALVLVLPADHWIGNPRRFHKAVKTAARLSDRTELFSIFGVRARAPLPSYGYLGAGKKVQGSIYELKQFIEKPSAARARRFLRTGRFFWHAGIFLASAATLMASLVKYAPSLSRRLAKITVQKSKVVPRKLFESLPHISFDCAVLERLTRAYLVRCDFDWCDVGTWNAFDGLWPKDRFQNSVWGTCRVLNSRRNIVYSRDKMTCLHGVNDLVVVDTPYALLVSRKGSSEEMRKVSRNFSKNRAKGV